MSNKLLLLTIRNININPKPQENISLDSNSDISDKDKKIMTLQSEISTSLLSYRQKLNYIYTNSRTKQKNIGIHNKDPDYVLDISGNLRVTKEVLINGDISGTSDLNIDGKIKTNTDYYINSYLLMPVGTIVQYVVPSPPEGWLSCDGSAISRTNYSRLFDIVGTTFGSGDGSTTFNLPNYKERVGDNYIIRY